MYDHSMTTGRPKGRRGVGGKVKKINGEWLKAVDSKSTVPLWYRGFESLPLRQLLGFPLHPFPSYDHSMTKSWVSPHRGNLWQASIRIPRTKGRRSIGSEFGDRGRHRPVSF